MLYQIAGGGEKNFLRCRYNGTLFLPDSSTWQGLKSSGSKNDVEMINFQDFSWLLPPLFETSK